MFTLLFVIDILYLSIENMDFNQYSFYENMTIPFLNFVTNIKTTNFQLFQN